MHPGHATSCPRCGTPPSTGWTQDHCPACGYRRRSASTAGAAPTVPIGKSGSPARTSHHSTGPSGGAPNPASRASSPRPMPGSSRQADGLGWLGHRRLVGTVIGVDGPYLAKPESTVLGFLATAALLPFIAVVLVALIPIWLVLSLLFSRGGGGRRGLLGGFGSQFTGLLVTRSLLRREKEEPVRDIRVRDDDGDEHLVRLRGDLVAGALGPGDDVEIEGWNRRGTLMFTRGWNRRTRTEIRTRRR